MTEDRDDFLFFPLSALSSNSVFTKSLLTQETLCTYGPAIWNDIGLAEE